MVQNLSCANFVQFIVDHPVYNCFTAQVFDCCYSQFLCKWPNFSSHHRL